MKSTQDCILDIMLLKQKEATLEKISKNKGATGVNQVYKGKFITIHKYVLGEQALIFWTGDGKQITTSAIKEVIDFQHGNYHIHTLNSVYELKFK